MFSSPDLPFEEEPTKGFVLKRGCGNVARRYDQNCGHCVRDTLAKEVEDGFDTSVVERHEGLESTLTRKDGSNTLVIEDPRGPKTTLTREDGSNTLVIEGDNGSQAILTKENGPKVYAGEYAKGRCTPESVQKDINTHVIEKILGFLRSLGFERVSPDDLKNLIRYSTLEEESVELKQERLAKYILAKAEIALSKFKKDSLGLAKEKLATNDILLLDLSRDELASIGFGLELNDPNDFPEEQRQHILARQMFMENLVNLYLKTQLSELLEEYHLASIDHPNKPGTIHLVPMFNYSKNGLQIVLKLTLDDFGSAREAHTVH
jgi:hypothetical protein